MSGLHSQYHPTEICLFNLAAHLILTREYASYMPAIVSSSHLAQMAISRLVFVQVHGMYVNKKHAVTGYEQTGDATPMLCQKFFP